MKFIKGFFSFFLTFLGFGLVIIGFSEFDFVVIGVGSVFLIPFLRRRFGGKKKKSISNKSSSIKKEKPQKKAKAAKPGLFNKALGSYNIETVLDAYVSNNEIKVKDLSEEEYQKLLGANSKILRKETYLFPLTYEIQLNFAGTYTGMAGIFDLNRWNSEMQQYNTAIKENNRLRERFEDQMNQYENQYQQYQHSQQIRKQTIGAANQNAKSAAWLLTSGGRKPIKPKLKSVKVPKAPKNKDDYTNFTDKKTGNLNWSNRNVNFFTRKFKTTVNFNNSHISLSKDNTTFTALINSYMKGYDEDLQSFNNNISEHSINLNIDSDIEPQTISLSDKELLGKEKKMNLNDRSGLEDTLFKEITNEVKDDIDAGTIKEISSDLRLKDVNFNLTELNYKINSTKFLPVQLIEFTDKKGKNIIKLLDFINKKIIKV
tara:strand:- start:36 stop:1322 length:1287 start_codon:yes stop_codon:yes gene_type:complete